MGAGSQTFGLSSTVSQARDGKQSSQDLHFDMGCQSYKHQLNPLSHSTGP